MYWITKRPAHCKPQVDGTIGRGKVQWLWRGDCCGWEKNEGAKTAAEARQRRTQGYDTKKKKKIGGTYQLPYRTTMCTATK